ncbi:thiamine phosphate synthase [Telmatospirillum sp. J64-1]|uniref:thiamine phosphate synthase n=1 Tax=Telmatospirillum sp. J64-1 TaxID=2502183 RepID=UPI00115E7631|nr:thiamine phosphate synthase [Telmatospirillum sp. J64-1]
MTQKLAEAALRLNSRYRRRHKDCGSLPAIILMTDAERLPCPEQAVAHLPPGSWVILRHYDAPERRSLGRALARLCREKRLFLLVAGDVRLAAELRADGLHLPEKMARGAAAKALAWRRSRKALLSIAAHSLPALRRAAALHADAATLSPVFPTASHPGALGLGVRRCASLCRSGGIPVYALGGIRHKNVKHLTRIDLAGLATVGGLSN